MIAPVRGVSGSGHTIEKDTVRQGAPRPPVRAPGASVVMGVPRPTPPTQPNGDPCALTLWGSEDSDRTLV